jgi:hypothetical protein
MMKGDKKKLQAMIYEEIVDLWMLRMQLTRQGHC